MNDNQPRPPFPPSWLDRLINKIDRLPGPAWVTYAAATALIVLLSIWGDRFQRSLAPAESTAFGAALTFFPIALVHYLDGVARRSLNRFRPVLSVSELELERLSYELTTLPRGTARAVSLLGAGLAVVGLFVSPEEMLGPPGMPVVLSILGFAGALFGYALFALLFYHTLRQLRLVSLIHARAATVSLLRPQPLYAFSNLTSRTAVALVLLSYYIVAVSSGTSMGPATIGLLGINLMLSVVLFALPLYGMHARLRDEKERMMGAVAARVEAVLTTLHRSLEDPAASNIDTINKGLASLLLERDLIAKSPTWPWTPGTLRAFASSVILPIVLFLLTLILERWIGP
ncbi:MAG TPA: hypothetical protein VJO34_16650 [Methylomirabilota bacterium]|nr:hypothetical protein [Methylomirabilota bacterium]